MKKYLLTVLLLVSAITVIFAQNNNNPKGQLHGNFNIDIQQYNTDSTIGAEQPPEKALMNAYGNFTYTYGKFSAGLRFESYLNTLEGYDKSYNGSGIPYKYLSYNDEETGLEITAGNFYEQFGNGLVLRSYQQRMLGYDNAFEGIRVQFAGIKGLNIKGLIGKQRLFWKTGDGLVRGVDAEFSLNELFKLHGKTQIIAGGSFVSK
jgi:hypothetical protein